MLNSIVGSCQTALIVLASIGLSAHMASAQGGFVRRTKVRVSGPTRMDWMYPTLRTTPKEQPENMMVGYKSTSQRYDFYGPRFDQAAEPHACVLFISYTTLPMGWNLLGPTCVREEAIYIEPHNAGNTTPMPERIRIALDCLDDVRRKFRIDPDRTYVAGYSGGGSTATIIGMALPEYFGGIIASSNRFGPPTTPWRIDRVRERLSIASICGAKEPAGFEMPNVQMPIFQALGIRMHSHAVPMLGHGAPPAIIFDRAFRWVDKAAAQRRRAAEDRVAIRIQGNPSREEWSAEALRECEELLKDPDQVHTALGLLSEITTRWPDTQQAIRAENILQQYDQKSDKPWVAIAKRERLGVTETMARTYDSAATAIVSTKIRRAVYAQGAIDNYQILIRDSGDEKLANQAKQRLPALQKLVENVPVAIPSTIRRSGRDDVNQRSRRKRQISIPSLKTNFNFSKGMPVDEVLQVVDGVLSKVGYEIKIDEKRIKDAGLTLKNRLTVDIEDQSLDETLQKLLDPIGLTHRISAKQIEVFPLFD